MSRLLTLGALAGLLAVRGTVAHAAEKGRLARDLIAFVGSPKSIEERPWKEGTLFSEYRARYRVDKLISGKYRGDEIIFTTYDHYGWPQFARHDHVLTFVFRAEGRLYQERYLFFPVYRTEDGRWAGCGKPVSSYFPRDWGKIKLVPIRFVSPARDANGKLCHRGIYAEDLYLLEKNGALKARGWH